MKNATKNATKIAAAALAAAMALAPAAHAQDDVDWTGGRPLPPGTEVPFEPGYASAWKMYDVIRLGDPRFRDYKVQGVRVIGAYDRDSMMCLMNAKGGRNGCYVDGKPVTDLGWGAGGQRVTVDPTVAKFAPIIKQLGALELELSSTQGSSLSS